MTYDSIASEIEHRLDASFALAHLEVINESDQHNVPPGSQSHFKLVLVASEFDGQRLLARHRAVNAVLADLLAGEVHALALHTYTAAEWASRFGTAPMSPPCLGGGGKDKDHAGRVHGEPAQGGSAPDSESL